MRRRSKVALAIILVAILVLATLAVLAMQAPSGNFNPSNNVVADGTFSTAPSIPNECQYTQASYGAWAVEVYRTVELENGSISSPNNALCSVVSVRTTEVGGVSALVIDASRIPLGATVEVYQTLNNVMVNSTTRIHASVEVLASSTSEGPAAAFGQFGGAYAHPGGSEALGSRYTTASQVNIYDVNGEWETTYPGPTTITTGTWQTFDLNLAQVVRSWSGANVVESYFDCPAYADVGIYVPAGSVVVVTNVAVYDYTPTTTAAPFLPLILALAIGVVIGYALRYYIERRKDRKRRKEEAEKAHKELEALRSELP